MVNEIIIEISLSEEEKTISNNSVNLLASDITNVGYYYRRCKL